MVLAQIGQIDDGESALRGLKSALGTFISDTSDPPFSTTIQDAVTILQQIRCDLVKVKERDYGWRDNHIWVSSALFPAKSSDTDIQQ